MTAPGALDGVTFEVAGLAARVECALPKPMLWVTDLHPAFRSTAAPDVTVTVVYDDGYWDRGLPWIGPDQVLDAPVYTEEEDGAGTIRTVYYEARIDAARRHVAVTMATGFGVGGLMRALYAMMLPRHRACLVRATVQPSPEGAILADGDDGVVALVDRGGVVEVEPTPFHAGTTATRPARCRINAIDLGGSARRADVAARVLARAITIDHSRPTLERVLDLVTCFVGDPGARH